MRHNTPLSILELMDCFLSYLTTARLEPRAKTPSIQRHGEPLAPASHEPQYAPPPDDTTAIVDQSLYERDNLPIHRPKTHDRSKLVRST